MTKLLISAACALALAGCQTTSIDAAFDNINAGIAQADVTLKKACPTLRSVVTASNAIAGSKQQKAFDQAKAALAVACDSPAQDIASAAIVVAAAVQAARDARLISNQ